MSGVHIKAKPGEIAENVVVVGDPGRAVFLSKLLEDARLVNDNRGLLVYTGRWKGVPITIATHGIGAPSAAIVFEELAMLGAKRLVRLGTAGGVGERVSVGSVIVADSASAIIGACGLSQYFDRYIPPMAPSLNLVTRLVEEVRRVREPVVAPVFCSDAFYSEDESLSRRLEAMGVAAIDMETAILYALSKARGYEVASVLIVSNRVGSRDFLPRERLESAVEKVGSAIFDALTEA